MVLFSPVPPPIYFHLIKVEKHPDKTFIDRIAKGFDFLAYNFEPKGLSIAPKTLANFLERTAWLYYEQGADVKRIGQYVRNYYPAGGVPSVSSGATTLPMPKKLFTRSTIEGEATAGIVIGFSSASSAGTIEAPVAPVST